MDKQNTLFDTLKDTQNAHNIAKRTTSIIPTNNIIPILNRSQMIEKIEDRKQILIDINNKDFEERKLNEGLFVYAKNIDDALLFAKTISNYKYALENPYITDLCSSIYTLITTNQLDAFYTVKIIKTEDIKTKKVQIVGIRVVLDLETVYLLTMGHILTNKARAIDGAGDIKDRIKKALLPFLKGEKDIPKQVTSLKNKKLIDGTQIPDIVMQDYPMRIHQITKINNRNIITIDLNSIFYPIKEKSGKYVTDNQYIHQVSGLTSFLAYGKKLYTETPEYQEQYAKYKKTKKSSDKPLLIDYQTARKIILTIQTSYNLEYLLRGTSTKTTKERTNIIVQTSQIKNLYPEAVSKDGRIRWKLFSDVASLSGKYYRLAMDNTGITEDLINDENIVIPAEDRACQFIKNKKIAYLKADKYIPKY